MYLCIYIHLKYDCIYIYITMYIITYNFIKCWSYLYIYIYIYIYIYMIILF